MANKSNKMAEKKELMVGALKKCLGIVSLACKEVRISRWTHYSWYKKDPEYAAKVDDINKVSIDFVENQLLKAIKGYKLTETKAFCFQGTIVTKDITKRILPDVTAIIFYLRTKGRSAGFDVNTPLPVPESKPQSFDVSKLNLSDEELKVLENIQRKLESTAG